MTIPPAAGPVGGAETLTVELDPHEAVAGIDKVVTLRSKSGDVAGRDFSGHRSIIVRVPPGVTHDTTLHLYGPDPLDPSALRDIHVRVLIRSDPEPEPPAIAPPTPAPETDPAPAPAAATFRPDSWTPPNLRTDWPALPAQPPPARRGRGRLLTVGAFVLVVLAGGGAVAAARAFIGDNSPPNADQRSDVGAGPPSSPTPAAKPVTAQEYRTLLANVDEAVAAPMRDLVAAKNPTALGKAATAVGTAAQAAYNQLVGVAAPTPAASAHRNLVRALGQFATVANETATAAGSGLVCAGSAAVPKLGNSPAATALRSAIQELAAVDPANPIKAGIWLPPPAAEETRQLANGTYVKKGSRNGSGHLRIDNSAGTADASMSLVPVGTKVTAFTVYVRAGASFTATGVKNGTYDVYLSSGFDWDPGAPGFSRDCAFSKFTDPLDYTSDAGQLTVWTITLRAAAGGNARTSDVSPDDFPQ